MSKTSTVTKLKSFNTAYSSLQSSGGGLVMVNYFAERLDALIYEKVIKKDC